MRALISSGGGWKQAAARLLVVFWPLYSFTLVNNPFVSCNKMHAPTYVSVMAVAKNIKITNLKIQYAAVGSTLHNIVYLAIINRPSIYFADFAWPYGGMEPLNTQETSACNHVSSDRCRLTNCTYTMTVGSQPCWGKAVILNSVTQKRLSRSDIRVGGWRAINHFLGKFEAAEDRSDVGSQLFPFSIIGDVGLSRGRISGSPSLINAAYGNDQNKGAYDSIGDRSYSSGAGPPPYLAVILGVLCVCGFLVACIGLEGIGHPVYLLGGLIISIASGGALI